jgi:hypothetical protein
LRHHRALIPSIGPPSGAYFKHCATVRHSFSASRHCQAVLLGIAPLPGIYQSSLHHLRDLSTALILFLAAKTHARGKFSLLLLEIWLSPMPSFVGVQPISTSLPELYQVEPNLPILICCNDVTLLVIGYCHPRRFNWLNCHGLIAISIDFNVTGSLPFQLASLL